jgi:hypothetical protein
MIKSKVHAGWIQKEILFLQFKPIFRIMKTAYIATLIVFSIAFLQATDSQAQDKRKIREDKRVLKADEKMLKQDEKKLKKDKKEHKSKRDIKSDKDKIKNDKRKVKADKVNLKNDKAGVSDKDDKNNGTKKRKNDNEIDW